ncbi:MAG: glycoside hydrolase family 31 protein [Victivallales bacterium]|nr:glycoside hydrolase family 31 protein [Victivallales bacterium]
MPQVLSRDIQTQKGTTIRVDVVTDSIFRIRVADDGDIHEGALNRYSVLRTDWPEVPYLVEEKDGAVQFDTGSARLAIRLHDGCMTFTDSKGKTLLSEAAAPTSKWADGFRAEFALGEDERLYGQGDETRDYLNKRGHANRMLICNVDSYVPIPFLMSTGGWAIFLNTTWFHHYDAGATDPDRLVYSAPQGGLDYYLIAGDSLPILLDRYTQLSGRPQLLPLSGYGLTFVCDERGVRARDVLYEAYEFRRHEIPCDTIGLEPDWMEHHYDFTVDKDWSKERFHIPFWLKGNDHATFTAGMKNMGFKLSLWLCCDYDVSEHEERLLGNDWPPTKPWASGRGDDDTFQDPHFIPTYTDKITKPGVPWFDHLKRFVDDGASAFKMDGANQVNFHPDRKWRNGMDDEEMHNLYPVLMNKQMSLGFREHTGRRSMVYTAGGYAGIQQFAATWAGDTGGNEGPLASILNHGLSGHSNANCDMEVWSAEGMHFGFLQPWSQVLSWHMYNQPWFLGEKLLAMFTFYAQFRYRLLPYIYSAAHVANRTGLPIARAMPLAYPDDPECANLARQYLFGDFFLTAAFTDRVYLPAGTWIDYWTGAEHAGPCWVPNEYPEDRGGPLFVKAGAIIPQWPPMLHVGHRPVDTLTLEIFPGGDTQFTLYEDDGDTLAHLDGAVAVTQITCRLTEDAVELTISPRTGAYEGMPENRSFTCQLHLSAAPQALSVNGEPADFEYDPDSALLLFTLHEDPTQQAPAIAQIELPLPRM